jgi:hypothetical protein
VFYTVIISIIGPATTNQTLESHLHNRIYLFFPLSTYASLTTMHQTVAVLILNVLLCRENAYKHTYTLMIVPEKKGINWHRVELLNVALISLQY